MKKDRSRITNNPLLTAAACGVIAAPFGILTGGGGGVAHGDPPRYRVVNLGNLPGPVTGNHNTEAVAINNWGQVVGTSKTCLDYDEINDICWSDGVRDFVWLPSSAHTFSVGMNMLPTPGGDLKSVVGINDDGHAVGQSFYYWNLADLNESRYLIVVGGKWVEGLNNQVPPRIVGAAGGLGFCKELGGNTTFLPGGPDHNGAAATAISDFELPVGYGRCVGACPGCNPQMETCELGHAWPIGDPVVVLESLEPEPFGHTPRAFALGVNSQHHIVGWGDEPLNPSVAFLDRALFWESTTAQPIPLPDLGVSEDSATYAFDIIDEFPDGEIQVVGRNDGHDVATLWRRVDDNNTPIWEAHDLNDLVECGDQLPSPLRTAVAINNAGWIVAHTFSPMHSWLLIPMDNCPGDLNYDGVVDVSDLLILLGSWGPCDPNDSHPIFCRADINCDGVVDVSDLLALLGSWGVCHGFPTTSQPDTLVEALEAAGLSQSDWDAFMNVMTTSEDARERENWRCWMERYLMLCVNCPTCPGPDPF